MAITTHELRFNKKQLNAVSDVMAYLENKCVLLCTIPAGATIIKALEADGDDVVIEYQTDEGDPTRFSVSIDTA